MPPVIETTRHKASIAGYVTDAVTGLPIPDAIVLLIGKTQQVVTRKDGFYHFVDLKLGTYSISVTAPLCGTRYGTGKVLGILAQNAPDGRSKIDPKASLALPPTTLTGTIRQSSDGTAVKGAVIRLLGSESRTVSDKDGNYMLAGITASSPNVQVSAPGFVTAVQKTKLTAGLATQLSFSLVKS